MVIWSIISISLKTWALALVVDNGKVVDLLMDKGMEDCTTISADNLLQLLTPDPSAAGSTDATEVDRSALLGVGAVGAALIASQVTAMVAIVAAALAVQHHHRNPHQRPFRDRPSTRTTSPLEGQSSLLNQYMKND
jgi:hypothetical protein